MMQTWYNQLISQTKQTLIEFSASKYYVAVSGGRDSVLLFHFLKDILPNGNLTVLHMNHNLRGEFSDQDQIFVEKLCQKYAVKYLSTKVNLELKPGWGGLENIARKTRYEWFKSQMENTDSILFCGHTLDDHLETVLMKIHRGSGLAGLKGISFLQKMMGVQICRPLLYTKRQQITQYLIAKDFQWREDHTNSELDFFRNKIRMNLIPKLSDSTKNRILKLSILSRQLQSFYKLPDGYLVSNGIEFNFLEIKKLSSFELRYLIEKIYQYFGLPSGPEKKHMDRFKAFLDEKKTHIQLSNFINIAIAREKVYFYQDNNEVVPFLMTKKLNENGLSGCNKNENFSVRIPIKLEMAVAWRWADFEQDFWQGKPLSSYIKKLKIPYWRKKYIPLCEYNGEILFISYLGVSKNYHNLISGHAELVTIEVLNKKVSL